MDDTKRIISKQILVDTADAIRAKKGMSTSITPSNFADEIASIEKQKPTQTKTVNPSTSQQIIEPDEGYDLSSVTVSAVDSSVDSNIKSNNIKKDVEILGIVGQYQENYIHQYYCSPLPEARSKVAAAIHVNNIFIFGGLDTNGNPTDTIYKYDMNKNKVTLCSAKLTSPMYGLTAATWGYYIYIFQPESKIVQIYNALKDTISSETVSPQLLNIKEYLFNYVLDNTILLVGKKDSALWFIPRFMEPSGFGGGIFYRSDAYPDILVPFSAEKIRFYDKSNGKVYEAYPYNSVTLLGSANFSYDTEAAPVFYGGKTVLVGGYSENQEESDLYRVAIIDMNLNNPRGQLKQYTGSCAVNRATNVIYGSVIFSIGGVDTVNGQEVPSNRIVRTELREH